MVSKVSTRSGSGASISQGIDEQRRIRHEYEVVGGLNLIRTVCRDLLLSVAHTRQVQVEDPDGSECDYLSV